MNIELGWGAPAVGAEITPIEPALVSTSEGIPLSMAYRHALSTSDLDQVGQLIIEFRRQTPLVQCLTNEVVSQITANALLAAGASPAMCDTPTESRAFAKTASGVIINGGTPTPHQYEGMREAIAGANEAGTPWALDPVAAGGLSERTEFYHEALTHNPWVIRGNASEIAALAGQGAGGRGVDSTDHVDDVIGAAQTLASHTGHVVAISGESDAIVSAAGVTLVRGGHKTMTKVIGTGCFLGALCAGYAGAAKAAGLDEHLAIVAAHAHTKAAGQKAGENYATKPGSFAVAWLDALAELDASDILARCQFTATSTSA